MTNRNMVADLKGGIKQMEDASADDDQVILREEASEVVLMIKRAYAGPWFRITTENVGLSAAGCQV
jgi:hypothetical protein